MTQPSSISGEQECSHCFSSRTCLIAERDPFDKFAPIRCHDNIESASSNFFLTSPSEAHQQTSELSAAFNYIQFFLHFWNQTRYLLKFDGGIPRCCAINLHSFLLIGKLRLPRNHKSIVFLRLSSVRNAWIIVRANTAKKALVSKELCR